MAFAEILDESETRSSPELRIATDMAQGRLTASGNPLDLAIAGPGFFRVRNGEQTLLARAGSFHVTGKGTLADAEGRVLLQADGTELQVSGGALEFLEDGTVLEDALPVGQVGLWELAHPQAARALGGSLFAIDDSAASEAGGSTLKQGFREESNVVLSDEMISITAAIRQAEGGGRIVRYYDELIGQAVQTFGGGGQ